MDHFSENLRYLRTQKKLSQDKLAEQVGATRGMIDSYERTSARPKAEIANKICKYFNVTIDDIYNKDLTGTVPKPAPVIPGTSMINKILQLFGYIPEQMRSPEAEKLLAEMIEEEANRNKEMKELIETLKKK